MTIGKHFLRRLPTLNLLLTDIALTDYDSLSFNHSVRNSSVWFLIGLDLCFGRWDNSFHALTDFGSVVPPPDINNTVISSPASLIFSVRISDHNWPLRKIP